MAKPNYRFDKRQREITKKQKQEEKRLKKLARNATAEAGEGSPALAHGALPASEQPPTQAEKTP